MSKLKKYIYPIIFSLSFFAIYFALGLIANTIFTVDYSGLALVMLFVIIWALIILPFYCVKYSKLIFKEKLNFLFCGYNCLVLFFIHIAPFNLIDEIFFAVIFLVWVLFWNILPLILRFISEKRHATLSPERLSSGNFLLQNKTKNIIAICFTLPFLAFSIFRTEFWQFYIPQYLLYCTLPTISPVFVLIFLLSENKNYALQNWLLPIAFTIEIVTNWIAWFSSLSSISIMIGHYKTYPISIAFSFLLNLSLIAILFGILFNFKYVKLLKYGSLSYCIISIIRLIFHIADVGGYYYINNLNGSFTLNIALIIESLLRLLFISGIFVLSTNKKEIENV